MRDEEFGLEILSQGGFVDEVAGETFRVDTWTVRLNGPTMNEYLFSGPVVPDAYPTGEAYELNRHAHETRRKLWETNLRKTLGVAADACFSYKQIISEIFGACLIAEGESKE